MLSTNLAGGTPGQLWKCSMNLKRTKLDATVATRISYARFKTLELWCNRSLRRKSDLLGIVLERVLEIYEREGAEDEPLEHFVRRLHLDRTAL